MTIETPIEKDKRIAYNSFNGYDEIPYQVINHLQDNNELIWKLLQYDTPDAYMKTSLTKAEKGKLIYNGEEITTDFRVFMDVGQPDAVTKEMTLLRISHWSIHTKQGGRTTGMVTLSFQVYSHYKINHLSNYKTRNDVIINELLKTLNGVQIEGGLGVLFFDGKRELTDRMIVTGQIPFIGKQLFMSMNYG